MRKIKVGYKFQDFINLNTVIDRAGNYVLLETVPNGGAGYYSIGRVLVVDGDEDIWILPGEYGFHEGATPNAVKTPLTLEEIRPKFINLNEIEQKKLAAMEARRIAQEKAHQEAVAKQNKLSREEKLARIYRAKDMRNAALDELRDIINIKHADEDIVELAKSKKVQQAVDRCNLWDYILSNLKS